MVNRSPYTAQVIRFLFAVMYNHIRFLFAARSERFMHAFAYCSPMRIVHDTLRTSTSEHMANSGKSGMHLWS